jgi:hypothetical protein
MPKSFRSRTSWRREVNRLRAKYLSEAERYISISPFEAPARFREPYSAVDWLKLTEDQRRDHLRTKALAHAESIVGPKPEAATPTLTLAELERSVLARSARRAESLRSVLIGDPATVESMIASQLPAYRAEVFDDLVRRYTIVN